MKRRSSLFALSVLALALACENSQQPTGLKSVPTDPSKIILDGAHGGNRDFFFLPPLVPLPTVAQGFDEGEFNNALRPSLTVEICRLKPDKLDSEHLPTPATPCYENGPFFRFAPGSVSLVNDPVTETGWWTGLNLDLPSDGFYYVQWDTRQAHLNAEKFYRVTVSLAGSTVPLGIVDIDPMKKESEFQQSRVGDVVQVTSGVLLPIPFRVENGALCGGAPQCTSSTVTNDNPNGDEQVVTIDGGGGAIAGASFPDGWLPAGGPQSVVVTIAEVPSAENGNGSRTRTTPCHVGLPFQQFNDCFNYTTTPTLADITPGVQFAKDVTVAVCFVLEGTDDQRRESSQLYASGPDEPPHALPEVDDEGILGAGARDCSTSEPEPIGLESSNPVTRLASMGWRTFKGGLSELFGVKTAYAVDGGLGGIVKGFSNIGPALTAEIEAYPHPDPEPPITELTLDESGTAFAQVRIVGSHSHAPGESQGAKDGINEVPVTFIVVPGSGTISDGEVDVSQDTVMTNYLDGEGPSGIASVVWTPPTLPGVYTLKATGPTRDTVTFTVTVSDAPPPAPDFVVSGAPVPIPFQITTDGGIVTLTGITVNNLGASFILAGGVRFGVYLSTDATITSADQLIGSANIPPSALEPGGTFNVPFPVGNIPAGVAVGNYFLGYLIDDNNAVAESNEGNNFVSAPLVVIVARRMLSMQTGATFQTPPTPPDEVATWLSSNPTDVSVSNGGLVTAIAGGEDIDGLNGANLTSVLTTGGAGPTMRVNTVFDIFPRTTTLVWVPVEGAVSYDVVTDYGNGCTSFARCNTWENNGLGNTTTTSSTYTFGFVGAQPGRWRVIARNAAGGPISISQYIYFRYSI